MIGFGYIPDPEDLHDRPLGALLGALQLSPPPARENLFDPQCTIKQQLGTQSCTGQAATQAGRLAYLRLGVPCPELSALDNYRLNRMLAGLPLHLDEGAYLRTAVAAATKFGFATEESWPFSEERVNDAPGRLARRSAHDLRGPRGYYRIDPYPDDVRRAIAAGFPVIGGFPVDRAFVEYRGQGVLTSARSRLGLHAIVLSGYEADGTFNGPGSWGFVYGRNGHHVVDEEFVRTGIDLWALDVRERP